MKIDQLIIMVCLAVRCTLSCGKHGIPEFIMSSFNQIIRGLQIKATIKPTLISDNFSLPVDAVQVQTAAVVTSVHKWKSD